jgi:hypothetical protein
MEHLGRYQQGDIVALSVLCTDANGAPTLPDKAPVAVLCSDTVQVLTIRLPIVDRYTITGFFQHTMQLGTAFVVGRYRVVYQYTLSGVAYAKADAFEVVAGGHADGAGLAMYYYRRPTSDYVLLQTDGGRLIRRRNPRLP